MRHQSGNVLFLILIAVVLFAALSYAITQSNRSGASAQTEQIDIAIAQWLQYATSIESAVTRVMLNGCSETDISFETSAWPSWITTSYVHSPAASTRCQIFHPQGGAVGANVRLPDGFMSRSSGLDNVTLNEWRTLYFAGDNAIDGVGTAASDLIIVSAQDATDNNGQGLVKDAICDRYNEKMHGRMDRPVTANSMNSAFKGDYTTTETVESVSGDPITGLRTACVVSGDGVNQFYYVILAR